MEETLKGILIELHHISLNTEQTFFDSSIFSTILGAGIAAIFGVMTTLFFEWRKERESRKIAVNTIYSEIELCLNTLEAYRRPHLHKQTGLPYITNWVIIPNPILESNSLEKYKPCMIKILDEESLRYIDDVYINFKRLDNLMSEIIELRSQFIIHSDKDQLAKDADDRLRMYWSMALSPESAKLIENGREVLRTLKRYNKSH